MNKRPYILVVALAVAFAGMIGFISMSAGLPMSHLLDGVLIGALLIGICLFVIKRRQNAEVTSSSYFRWPKYVLASFVLAFASWMLGSILLLPFIGYMGFELMQRPWFGAAWCALALAYIPMSMRYVR